MTWVTYSNNTSAALYWVYDGTASGTLLKTVTVNQQVTPPVNATYSDDGWLSLGYFSATAANGGKLTVKLTNGDGNNLIADAVRIVPVSCISTAYDADGNVQAVTDPRGFVTTYVYDESDRKTQQILPDPDGSGPLTSSTTQYGYDSDSNLTSVKTPNQDGSGVVETDYGYDALGRKTSQTLPPPVTGMPAPPPRMSTTRTAIWPPPRTPTAT